MFISWEAYVNIRPKILDAKANETIFVYVIMHIINKNKSMHVDQPRRNIYGELSSTR